MADLKLEEIAIRQPESGDNSFGFDSLGNPIRAIIDASFKSFDSLTTAIAFVTANPSTIKRLSASSRRNEAECLALSIPYPDGGGADYVVEALGTPDGYGDHAAGTKQLTLNISTEIMNLLHYGGIGNDANDNTSQKNAMITARGFLRIPLGIFRIDKVVPDAYVVEIFGESRNKSVLKAIDNSDENLISIINNGGLFARNVTLDQNRDNQLVGGHGIRSGGCSILDIESVTIQNCNSYGIGLQSGTSKGVKISNVLIDTVGSDGIDCKDFNFDNDVIQIDNLTVKNYGINGVGQVGVDVRGPVVLTNLVAIPNNPDTRAFRLREGNVQGRNGSGSATGIYYKSSDAISYAVQISPNCTDYSISNVEAEDCGLVVVTAAGSAGSLKGLVGRNISGDALSIDGDGNTIDGVRITGCSRGADFETGGTNNTLTNFDFSGVTGGSAVRFRTGSNNRLTNGRIEEGKVIDDSGTDTVIDNVINYRTKSTVESDDIPVDITGNTELIVPHLLSVTPLLSDITPTIIRGAGNPNDYSLGYLQVVGASGTSITCIVRVDVASGTAGSTIKLSIKTTARNS